MGKIKQGILGGFNGTTGSVVGASWKGIAYMRGKAQSIKNPRTASQQENRTRFGSISDFLSKCLVAVRLGFAGLAVKKSPFNVAVTKNMDGQLHDGESLNPQYAIFSDGNMYPFVGGSVALGTNQLDVTLTLPTTSTETHKVCLVASFLDDSEKVVWVQTSTVAVSSTGTSLSASIPLPSGIDYAKAQVSAFRYDDVAKDASPTTYIGDYTPE